MSDEPNAELGTRSAEKVQRGVYRAPNGKELMVVRYTQFPGDADYDGGLPGVGITWGRQRWFVPARDPAAFWNLWPYSLFKTATVEPSSVHPS